jgi:hypothetical protein
MDEQYQITIPPSFMAIYSRNGRATETRQTIEARYDLCEDLAAQTAETCHVLQFRDDLSETEILKGCHAGLQTAGAVSRDEADWVVSRTAELLGWPIPVWPPSA